MRNANKTYSILIGGRVTRRWKDPSDAWEAAPTVCTVVICFASFLGSSNGLEFEHQREVGSVSGEVLLSQGDATSICSITEQPLLLLISATRIAIGAPCGVLSLYRERYGLTLFR
jgi:hypothetical protein